MQQKPKKKFNLFNFKEQNKSKTIKAIDLKPRLNVTHIHLMSFENDQPRAVSVCSVNLYFLVIYSVANDYMS